jgi:hypothetical protein
VTLLQEPNAPAVLTAQETAVHHDGAGILMSWKATAT